MSDTTINELIDNAINLLEGDYVWSKDFEQMKPVLLNVLNKRDSTAILLAEILERE
jgi:hypothetical protein